MTTDSAKAFLEKMKTDDGFAKSVTEAVSRKARADFVKAAGFDFSADELNAEVGELSDADLDGVVGGAGVSRDSGKFGSLSDATTKSIMSKGGLATDCQNDGNESVCVCG